MLHVPADRLSAECKATERWWELSPYDIETGRPAAFCQIFGVIEGKQDVEVRPQVSGTITQVCVEEGARVRKGQVLFIIDQVPYKAALQKAEAAVATAEAGEATARQTLEGKQSLFDDKVISDFELRTAQNDYKSAKAALLQAQAEMTEARNNLSYTEVKSPVTGMQA